MEHTHTVTCKRSRLTFLTLCWEKKKKGDAKDIQNTGVYHYCCWNLNNILLVLSYLRHLTVCSGTTVDTNTLTEGNPLQHFKDLLDTMQTYCTTLELLAAVMNVSRFAQVTFLGGDFWQSSPIKFSKNGTALLVSVFWNLKCFSWIFMVLRIGFRFY